VSPPLVFTDNGTIAVVVSGASGAYVRVCVCACVASCVIHRGRMHRGMQRVHEHITMFLQIAWPIAQLTLSEPMQDLRTLRLDDLSQLASECAQAACCHMHELQKESVLTSLARLAVHLLHSPGITSSTDVQHSPLDMCALTPRRVLHSHLDVCCTYNSTSAALTHRRVLHSHLDVCCTRSSTCAALTPRHASFLRRGHSCTRHSRRREDLCAKSTRSPATASPACRRFAHRGRRARPARAGRIHAARLWRRGRGHGRRL
jgi:hypothetical protein